MQQISTDLNAREINKKLNLCLLLFIVPLAQISVDLYSPSLPYISKQFLTTNAFVQNTITLYFLGFGLGQIFFGPLSDFIGRKKTIVFGLLCFFLFSILSPASPNIIVFLLLRFFQGVFASSLSVVVRASCVDMFGGNSLIKVSSYIGIVWGFSPIIAPAVGGYFQYVSGWKLSFYFLAFYSLIAFSLFKLYFEETLEQKTQYTKQDLFSRFSLIIKNRDFLFSTLMISSTNYGIFIFAFMGTFFIQDVLHKSSIFYGYSALAVGLIYIIGAYLSKIFLKYVEPSRVIYCSVFALFFLSIISVLAACMFKNSFLVFMLIASFYMLISGFIYPFLSEKLFRPFRFFPGLVSSAYGFISYVFSTGLMFIMSFIKVNSMIPIAFAYSIIGIISLFCLKLFKP